MKKRHIILIVVCIVWVLGRTAFALTYYEESKEQGFAEVLGRSVFWVWIPVLIYGLVSWVYDKRKKSKAVKD